MMAQVAFYILAGLAVVSALGVITRENPVHSALWMLLTFFSVAGIFVQLGAEFVAAIQVLVYAGAILVLYLFVVMLLNPRSGGFIRMPAKYIIGSAVSVVVFFQIAITIWSSGIFKNGAIGPLPYVEGMNNVRAYGNVLFTKYLVPFEIASILLLVAMIGAIVIARKD
ncbi:MAG: NADH-quinone oxidoreductase subunit J [Geovibrio sp.]|jgi:NADH-quinone oxidoreductase subunit J|nr:NADH-quinone oxidoreductase subunit J [Geovibrio sp.]MCD8568263.1 NADH-quinone oxidoreductase subunit J [Geovibrio sp.]